MAGLLFQYSIMQYKLSVVDSTDGQSIQGDKIWQMVT